MTLMNRRAQSGGIPAWCTSLLLMHLDIIKDIRFNEPEALWARGKLSVLFHISLTLKQEPIGLTLRPCRLTH